MIRKNWLKWHPKKLLALEYFFSGFPAITFSFSRDFGIPTDDPTRNVVVIFQHIPTRFWDYGICLKWFLTDCIMGFITIIAPPFGKIFVTFLPASKMQILGLGSSGTGCGQIFSPLFSIICVYPFFPKSSTPKFIHPWSMKRIYIPYRYPNSSKMRTAIYGCFQKYWYPQIIPFW